MTANPDASGPAVEAIYEAGKRGAWSDVERAFLQDPALAGGAVRHVKPSSGWTLLHQAAYWGSKDAARLCLTYGGSLEAADNRGKVPADVAAERGHAELAEWLRAGVVSGVWKPVPRPTMRASSCKWGSHVPATGTRTAAEDFTVAYAGGVVRIGKGRTYHVDDWGRVLVGWHGTFDPPCDMGGESIL